jgi:F-type H+-transporting ATPase subunit delta
MGLFDGLVRTAARTRVMPRGMPRALPQGVRAFSDGTMEGRYAAALFQTAKTGKALDKVAEDMKNIREMVGDSKEFRTFVYTPGIAADEKMAAVAQISKKMSPMSQNFLMLLVENKRMDLVTKMIDSFEELYREEKGIKVAKVVTAAEITTAQKKSITQAVQAVEPGKQLTFEYEVQPAMLGGFVVKLGQKVLDYSVSAKIDKMSTQLLAPVA